MTDMLIKILCYKMCAKNISLKYQRNKETGFQIIYLMEAKIKRWKGNRRWHQLKLFSKE